MTFDWVPWVTGALTVAAMELVGRKRWEGWALGLLNQGFWFYLVYDRALWGLLPLTAILTWRYTAALIRWRRDVTTPRAAGAPPLPLRSEAGAGDTP